MANLGFHCHQLDILEEVTVGNGLTRCELYNLPADELPRLRQLIDHHKLDWSIHTPLVRIDWYPQPPTWSFLCDVDKDNRDLTMKMITQTVQHAEEFGAEYVIVHFPAPASDASDENEGKLEEIAWRSCERIAELSFKRNVPIHIEGIGQTHLINAEFLCAMLKEFSPLRYCFDTAHSNLSTQYNSSDLYGLEEELLPYIGSMHLWNTRSRDDYLAFRHIPVHPSQDPGDGWVDIPRVMRALGTKKGSLPIIFESEPQFPKALGAHDYREGIEWVKELLEI